MLRNPNPGWPEPAESTFPPLRALPLSWRWLAGWQITFITLRGCIALGKQDVSMPYVLGSLSKYFFRAAGSDKAEECRSLQGCVRALPGAGCGAVPEAAGSR